MTRALVVLNAEAGGGQAGKRWEKVRPFIREQYAHQEVRLDRGEGWRCAVKQALDDGVRVFIAAGGDGTVNLLLNGLLQVRGSVPLPSLALGAVGLGSSNDFHKPIERTAAGCAIRRDLAGRTLRDVCRARYRDASGTRHERCFLVSASMGVTAEANARFNADDRVLLALKHRCFTLAMLYAALLSIGAYHSFEAYLAWCFDGQPVHRRTQLTNLSLLKTPHLSGGLRFDTRVACDDGLLGVNLCEGMSRRQIHGVLFDLSQGRFRGRPGRSHWQTPRLALASPHPVALELDGEVVQARRVDFDVLAERIGVCA
jgi:diacylglycerol kinase (ATP)